MLTCRELTELITDHLEGRLPLGEQLRFQLHLGVCRDCRAYLRQLRVTLRVVGGLLPEPPPPGVREQLLERFRGWKRGA